MVNDDYFSYDLGVEATMAYSIRLGIVWNCLERFDIAGTITVNQCANLLRELEQGAEGLDLLSTSAVRTRVRACVGEISSDGRFSLDKLPIILRDLVALNLRPADVKPVVNRQRREARASASASARPIADVPQVPHAPGGPNGGDLVPIGPAEE